MLGFYSVLLVQKLKFSPQQNDDIDFFILPMLTGLLVCACPCGRKKGVGPLLSESQCRWICCLRRECAERFLYILTADWKQELGLAYAWQFPGVPQNNAWNHRPQLSQDRRRAGAVVFPNSNAASHVDQVADLHLSSLFTARLHPA